MDTERLNIFDENRVHIGVATRGEVHHWGYWHDPSIAGLLTGRRMMIIPSSSFAASIKRTILTFFTLPCLNLWDIITRPKIGAI